MTLRLRQICLVASHLEPSVSTICTVLGTMVCYVDPQVEKYGLVNALMPIGNSFLEVVAPTRDGTAAGQLLSNGVMARAAIWSFWNVTISNRGCCT